MMVVFFCFAFPALGLCVVTALYPEKVTGLFAGSGSRRFTVRSAAEASESIRVLRMQLSEAQRPKACLNCGHMADGVMPTVAEIADSDRTDTSRTINAPAPADNGSRDFPLTAAETARDTSLTAMALPGEEEMAAFLEAEQAKNRAKADTVTLPAVAVKPLHEAQAELAWANGTPPPAGASATEVSAITGALASHKVELAVSEAS